MHPGFRERFPLVDFTMCGSVRNRDASCSLRERSKFQKVHFTFPSLDGTLYRAAIAIFIQQTIKNGL